MQYLNILYALILAIYGYRFLKSDGRIVKGALCKDESFHYSGTELFWCLTFATGSIALSLDVGLDLMALRLLVLEIFCIIGLRISTNQAVISAPLKIYIAFLIWITVGLIYSPSPAYGVRTILKYLYPILLCCFASATVRDPEVFFKSSLLARTVGVISIALIFIPYSVIKHTVPNVFWYETARAIHYISLMVFSLGMFFFTNRKKENMIYIIIFIFPCLYWVLRTSIMGSLVAIMAFFFIKYRLKSLPVIAGVLVLGVAAVFLIPSVRQKMFFDDNVTITDFREGKIDQENINTNARSAMWEHLEKKFYQGNETSGSGTGAVQAYMYNNKEVFEGLMVPHSDFVQQKCDNGLIGLIIYGAMIFFVFADCFRTYWRARSAPLQLCAIVAGASIIGVYATFYSDNVVNYSMATLSMPFGFYGMMLGLRRSEEEN
ncbi:MAG: O-antigen ligase family protein [Muribaculaceae bacterium]|nr:O-antigen ligase family protein [Muribaculaceae bacterium]